MCVLIKHAAVVIADLTADVQCVSGASPGHALVTRMVHYTVISQTSLMMKPSEHNTASSDAWEVIFSSLVITLRSLDAVIICLLDWFASFIL